MRPLLALILVWLLAATASGQPAPLAAAQRTIAEAVPDGRAGTVDRAYVVSNEWAHRLFFSHLSGLGGAIVAVGADQVYTMAAVAGADLIWAIDYDPTIAAVHRMYGALIAGAASPDALLARFEPGAEEASAEQIGAHYEGARRDAAVRVYRRHRARLAVYLRRLHRYRQGRTWLNDDALYAHVRALHRGGRVIARTGDIGGSTTLSAIGAASRQMGIPVRIVYLSNAEMFVPNRPQLVSNMRGLPTDERSVLLRTVFSPRLTSAPRDHWHYVVQPFPDYLARLGTGNYLHANTIVEDLIRAHRGGSGASVIDGSIPMRR